MRGKIACVSVSETHFVWLPNARLVVNLFIRIRFFCFFLRISKSLNVHADTIFGSDWFYGSANGFICVLGIENSVNVTANILPNKSKSWIAHGSVYSYAGNPICELLEGNVNMWTILRKCRKWIYSWFVNGDELNWVVGRMHSLISFHCNLFQFRKYKWIIEYLRIYSMISLPIVIPINGAPQVTLIKRNGNRNKKKKKREREWNDYWNVCTHVPTEYRLDKMKALLLLDLDGKRKQIYSKIVSSFASFTFFDWKFRKRIGKYLRLFQ